MNCFECNSRQNKETKHLQRCSKSLESENNLEHIQQFSGSFIESHCSDEIERYYNMA